MSGSVYNKPSEPFVATQALAATAGFFFLSLSIPCRVVSKYGHATKLCAWSFSSASQLLCPWRFSSASRLAYVGFRRVTSRDSSSRKTLAQHRLPRSTCLGRCVWSSRGPRQVGSPRTRTQRIGSLINYFTTYGALRSLKLHLARPHPTHYQVGSKQHYHQHQHDSKDGLNLLNQAHAKKCKRDIASLSRQADKTKSFQLPNHHCLQAEGSGCLTSPGTHTKDKHRRADT